MSAVVRRTIEVAHTLGGEQVADLFWELDSDEQADFFNRLDQNSDGEHHWRLPMQMQNVTDSTHLDKTGRRAMRIIGEYSAPSIRGDAE